MSDVGVNPIHALQPYFPEMQFNILHLCLGLLSGLFL
jgi:hypothetical protein